jgi:PAS domain S-box-containing protein
MKGEFEKRVFATFFIVTFLMVLLLTLLAWQLVSYSIRQNEENKIMELISLVETEYERYVSSRTDYLSSFYDSLVSPSLHQENLAEHFLETKESFEETYPGLFVLYDQDGQLVQGSPFPELDRYAFYLLNNYYRFEENSFPLAFGRDVYFLFYKIIDFEMGDDKRPVGILIYLDVLRTQTFSFPPEARPVVFSGFQTLQANDLPESYQPLLTNLRNKSQKALGHNRSKAVIRLNIDLGGGLYTKYDPYGNSSLHFFIPFTRDFNSFAHKGLLVIILVLTSISLLMISLSGAWFSKRILAPIKDLSNKMEEIEQNPSVLEPVTTKYVGSLGKMVATFNRMNDSINRYSQTLTEYKTITTNLDSGVLWMDETFKIILCNPAILTIFGLNSYDEVIGKKLEDLVSIKSLDVEKARQGGLFIPQFEITGKDQSRYIKFVLFNVRMVYDKTKLRYITSITDITKETKETKARERLEIELIKSNRLADIGRLAEGIVHNINSPLNTIVGYAQLLKRKHPDNTDIDKILNSGGNIANIVRKLLMKIKEDSISMMRPVDINEVIEQELDVCQHDIFYAHNVTLKKELTELQHTINASHGDISICIANLIHNAIQAMEKSPEKILSVKSYQKDKNICIIISDTGKGIAKEDIDKIFAPEYSTKSSEDGEGFGLGLAISKSLIEKYQGFIRVESEIDVGSCFTICLPIPEIKANI